MSAGAARTSSIKAVDLECQKVGEASIVKIKALHAAIQQLEAARSRVKASLESMRAVVVRYGA